VSDAHPQAHTDTHSHRHTHRHTRKHRHTRTRKPTQNSSPHIYTHVTHLHHRGAKRRRCTPADAFCLKEHYSSEKRPIHQTNRLSFVRDLTATHTATHTAKHAATHTATHTTTHTITHTDSLSYLSGVKAARARGG